MNICDENGDAKNMPIESNYNSMPFPRLPILNQLGLKVFPPSQRTLTIELSKLLDVISAETFV